MSETTVEKPQEKKTPVRNLERVGLPVKFNDYEAADKRRSALKSTPGVEKLKIFARWDGTFDLVAYKKVGAKEAPAKVAQAPEKASEAAEKRVHGLRSKDRKKSPKKAR